MRAKISKGSIHSVEPSVCNSLMQEGGKQEPVVIGGIICPPPVGIGLTDLSNIGPGSGIVVIHFLLLCFFFIKYK